jgi:hypothetical protein
MRAGRNSAWRVVPAIRAFCNDHAVDVVILAGLVVFSLTVLMVTGVLPKPTAGMDQAISDQIEYENGIACERFGFHTGSDQHAYCCHVLSDLQQRHERLRAELYDFP